MSGHARSAEPGWLITLEGVEGAGKSTQLTGLQRWLVTHGHRVVITSEPDGTPLGVALRRLLGDSPAPDPLAETLLFAASRAEHVRRVIRPALAAGALVLCDRFGDSTVAYQGHGRGVPIETITELNRIATAGLVPDLTIVLDLEAAEGLARVGRRCGPLSAAGTGGSAPEGDAFERLGLEFHERVRKGYWAIREREPHRVVMVDATRPAAAVTAEIAALIAARLDRP